MSLSKRVQMVVLCLIVVALSAAAAAPLMQGTAKLQPVVGGDEPNASGSASLQQTGWVVYPGGGRIPTFTLSIRCTGLTPGATYAGPWVSATADRKGSLVMDGKWTGRPNVVEVSRLDPGMYVLVLEGTVVWK
jgi:hypothetical protein